MNREHTCGMCCGAGGSIAGLAFLFWLGVPPVLAALSFIGLQIGSLNPVLAPLIVAALGLVSAGLWLSVKSHRRGEPFTVGLVGATATVIGLFAWPPIATFGILIVAGSILWNQLLLKRLAHR